VTDPFSGEKPASGTQSDLRTVIFARISWFFAPNEMSNSARRVTTIYQVHRDHSAKPHYFIHLEKNRGRDAGHPSQHQLTLAVEKGSAVFDDLFGRVPALFCLFCLVSGTETFRLDSAVIHLGTMLCR
jgi:hypothetical protein